MSLLVNGAPVCSCALVAMEGVVIFIKKFYCWKLYNILEYTRQGFIRGEGVDPWKLI